MPPPAFGNRWRHRGGRAPARFAVTRPRELLGQGYVLVAVSAWQWEDGSWHDMVVLDRQGYILGWVRHGTHRVAGVNLKKASGKWKRY